jgi:hypothetical protein
MSGFLEVGLSEDGKEVVINHPDLKPDANGVGHIVFSAWEAKSLGLLLLKKADEVNGPRADDASPGGMLFAAHVIHRLQNFVAKATEELLIVEREIGVPSEALKLLRAAESKENALRT